MTLEYHLNKSEEERYIDVANNAIQSVLSIDCSSWKIIQQSERVRMSQQHIRKKRYSVRAMTRIPGNAHDIIAPLTVHDAIGFRELMKHMYGTYFVDSQALFRSSTIEEHFSMRKATFHLLQQDMKLTFIDYSRKLPSEGPCFIRVFESVYLPTDEQDTKRVQHCTITRCAFIVHSNSVLEFLCSVNIDDMNPIMRQRCRRLIYHMGRGLENFMNVILSSQLSPQLISKEQWVADSVRKECTVCKKPFSFNRRRHHCRCCGEIACWRCCPFYKITLPIRGLTSIRICVICIINRTSVELPTEESDAMHPSYSDGSSVFLRTPSITTSSNMSQQDAMLDGLKIPFNQICASLRSLLDVPVALIVIRIRNSSEMLLFGLGQQPLSAPQHILQDGTFCTRYGFQYQLMQPVYDDFNEIGYVVAADVNEIEDHDDALRTAATEKVPMMIHNNDKRLEVVDMGSTKKDSEHTKRLRAWLCVQANQKHYSPAS